MGCLQPLLHFVLYRTSKKMKSSHQLPKVFHFPLEQMYRSTVLLLLSGSLPSSAHCLQVMTTSNSRNAPWTRCRWQSQCMLRGYLFDVFLAWCLPPQCLILFATLDISSVFRKILRKAWFRIAREAISISYPVWWTCPNIHVRSWYGSSSMQHIANNGSYKFTCRWVRSSNLSDKLIVQCDPQKLQYYCIQKIKKMYKTDNLLDVLLKCSLHKG